MYYSFITQKQTKNMQFLQVLFQNMALV